MKYRTQVMRSQKLLNKFSFRLMLTPHCFYSKLDNIQSIRPLNYSVQASNGSPIDSKILNISTGKNNLSY